MARERAGLPHTISLHDLRHFYASALINAGCSVKQVQLALGHKSARVTLDVYGHLWPGEEDRVRDAIGLVFRPSADFRGPRPGRANHHSSPDLVLARGLHVPLERVVAFVEQPSETASRPTSAR